MWLPSASMLEIPLGTLSSPRPEEVASDPGIPFKIPIIRDSASWSIIRPLHVLVRGAFVSLAGDGNPILVSTPRINTLSDWSLRRGASQFFFLVGDLGGAPPK